MTVKINQRFQDLHSQDGATDWVAIQSVERDICLLYHQLADYSYIMGDLYYGDVFGLPYWEYLNVGGIEPQQRDFIRSGCLVFLFAMASEVLDGSGSYLTMDKERYVSAKKAVGALPEFGDDTDRLRAAVQRSFDLIDKGGGTFDESDASDEVNTFSTWIHERFVRRYFEDLATQFAENPYYQGKAPDEQ